MLEVEHVLSVQNKLGEGPRWHVGEQALYWVDIESGFVYRWQPGDATPIVLDFAETQIGSIAFRQDGALLMATDVGFMVYDPKLEAVRFIESPEQDREGGRFNDGVVDRNGRFWVGSLGPGFTSALYRLDPDETYHTMQEEIGVSNGIGWSPDNRTMYYADSGRATIYSFDFDADTGAISNRRPFVQVEDGPSVPDGLTVDSEGYVWSAFWDGGTISRFAPDGTLDQVIEFPVSRITACTFGGPNLDELYVTSAWTGLTDEQRSAQPLAGDLFRVKTNVRGVAEPFFGGA